MACSTNPPTPASFGAFECPPKDRVSDAHPSLFDSRSRAQSLLQTSNRLLERNVAASSYATAESANQAA